MGLVDTAIMFCKYVAAPRRTGTVCPSSKYLARRMVATVGKPPSECSAVVELGAGTGAITKYLVEAGYADNSKLFCIEFDEKLCEILKQKFPAANILNGSAENIRKLVGSAEISAIVSGLPLVSLPREVVRNIVSEVEDSLPSGGRFSQFTYSLLRPPEVLGFSRMRHLGASVVLANIPPARVDTFEKM